MLWATNPDLSFINIANPSLLLATCLTYLCLIFYFIYFIFLFFLFQNFLDTILSVCQKLTEGGKKQDISRLTLLIAFLWSFPSIWCFRLSPGRQWTVAFLLSAHLFLEDIFSSLFQRGKPGFAMRRSLAWMFPVYPSLVEITNRMWYYIVLKSEALG